MPNTTRPLYIFDLDGTLADLKHRRHFVEGPKKDWDAFHAACNMDSPIQSTIDTLKRLYMSGAEIWIFSGRSDIVRLATLTWLHQNNVPYDFLQMRHHGDHTPDDELKERWLVNMLDYDRDRLVAVFDDRDRVVSMWRLHDITCYQVAPGDF